MDAAVAVAAPAISGLAMRHRTVVPATSSRGENDERAHFKVCHELSELVGDQSDASVLQNRGCKSTNSGSSTIMVVEHGERVAFCEVKLETGATQTTFLSHSL